MQENVAVVGNIVVDRVIKKDKRGSYLQGFSTGGAMNSMRYLRELIGGNHIFSVSNIGDDELAKKYIEPELKVIRDDYVQIMENAETRYNEVDITEPSNPDIRRLQRAEKLMNIPYADITAVLPSLSTLYLQSQTYISPDFKGREELVKTMKKASEEKVHVMMDWNKILSGKVDKMEEDALCMIDTLKMSDVQAEAFLNHRSSKKPTTKEVFNTAAEILDKYNIKRVVITRGSEGSSVVTPEVGLIFDALKPRNISDTTGAGDVASTPYCIKEMKGLSEVEAGVLSQILACQYIEGNDIYPRTADKSKIAEFIVDKHSYCLQYAIRVGDLLGKLGLKT